MKNNEFLTLVRDILSSEEFKKMKTYRHHLKGSAYDHSVKVAYLCYVHHKKFKTKIALEEFVKGALLHDYYLYDHHDKNDPHKHHWFKHPKHALSNALKKYPNLTKTQMDMIRRHMFPLTPIPPHTKAGWLLCFYDKVAAVSDCFGKNKWEYGKNRSNISTLTFRKHFAKKSKTTDGYSICVNEQNTAQKRRKRKHHE